MVEIGDYVLATKYSDGSPSDPWAVGYYLGLGPDGVRHLVGDEDGKSFYRNGYRRVRGRLLADVGAWLVTYSKELEKSPGGLINLWDMIGDRGFEDVADRETAGAGADDVEGEDDDEG